MRNDKKIKTILGMALLFLSLTFVGCTSISGTSGVSGQETEKDSTSMNKEEDAYEDEQHEEAEVMQSPDKYTWYIKDYVGKNVAAFGYTSMGGDRMDRYGEGYVKLILVNEDGSYIDINNEEDLKSYIVAAQNIKPNTELKYVFEKDEEGEEYSPCLLSEYRRDCTGSKEIGKRFYTKRPDRDYCFTGSVYLVYSGLCRQKSVILRICLHGWRI